MAGGLAHRYPHLATLAEGLCSKVEVSWGFLCGEDSNLWSLRKTFLSMMHMTPISSMEISEVRFPTVNNLKIGKAWTIRVSVLL
jgi:hypothetical protein